MVIKRIETKNAPAAGGHYSQAVVHNGLVFVSGQLSIDPQTGERKLGSIEEQTEQVLKNVEAILKAANSDFSRVLKMTVYVADIEREPWRRRRPAPKTRRRSYGVVTSSWS